MSSMMNKMIVIDGVDGSGKGVQTRRLHQSILDSGLSCVLTREPGGSAAAEDIRELLVNGDPEKWDSMTELLLMVAARRAHLRDTIWPTLEKGSWVLSDRFADSSRAFQGIAGELGLDVVNEMHKLSIGDFNPDFVLILDIDEHVALARAEARGTGEDRFEKKGNEYHRKVRNAFRDIAESNQDRYKLIDASGSMDEVTSKIISAVNSKFSLNLSVT
ncbi:MAG: dTMP kinase [Gammaproteobacteria bacterium]|jgi:dTMP kinase|nr:dTMP kinase [Gammaproteobacteria bacterium]MBT3723150.1 dTMP kinase [Gammaproteobacteria bacterium]MBT4076794.1 dTMP kinase [Gammaproteobacteria bacterium]MBT4196174.1 dTMP kinase [Gammaproteobacteria bacterium]MBT4448301.1 dTMP kinase [Gammaproteobacteria bacterium]